MLMFIKCRGQKTCPQITTLEKKGELKRIRTEVPLLKTGIYGHIWKHGGSNIASKYALCMGKQKIRLDSQNLVLSVLP